MYLLALGEEGSEHDGTRDTQILVTEVSFSRGGLDGDRLAPGVITADGEFLHRPNGETNISKGGTGDILGVLALTCTQE